MAKPSDITAGDALVMGADVLKLLAPVLKCASKHQIEKLKRHSKGVQEIFQRMLDDDLFLIDRSSGQRSTQFINKTDLEFEKNLSFKVCATTHGNNTGTFDVSIVFPGIDIALWTHHLPEPINWLGVHSNGYVSFNEALDILSRYGVQKLREKIQSSLLTHGMSISFSRVKGTLDLCSIWAQYKETDYQCESYVYVEELKRLLKSA